MTGIGELLIAEGLKIVVVNIISNIFSSVSSDEYKKNQSQKNLENFLKILSEDFAKKVENAIQNAFLSQNFQDIKVDTASAAIEFRDYSYSISISKRSGDQASLERASGSIIRAFARLKILCDEIIKGPIPSNGSQTKNYCKKLEIVLYALRAISALDILILVKRIEFFPGLLETLHDNLSEYIHYLSSIKKLYMDIQDKRVSEGRHMGDGFHAYMLDEEIAIRPDPRSIRRFPCADAAGVQVFNITYHFPPPISHHRECYVSGGTPGESVRSQIVDTIKGLASDQISKPVTDLLYLLKELKSITHQNLLKKYIEDGECEKIVPMLGNLMNHQIADLLYEAIKGSNLKLAKLYIDAGGSLKKIERGALNILVVAGETKNEELIKLIFEKYELDSDDTKAYEFKKALALLRKNPDCKSIIPLIENIMYKQCVVEDALGWIADDIYLKHFNLQNVDINFKNPRTGETALHQSVPIYVKYKAKSEEPGYSSTEGCNAEYRYQLYSVLITAGIDVLLKDNRGETAKDKAKKLGATEIVDKCDEIIRQKFTSDENNNNKTKSCGMCGYYFKAKFDPNFINPINGETSLHRAILNQNSDLAWHLLDEHHIDIDKKNADGQTAQELATAKKFLKMENFFKWYKFYHAVLEKNSAYIKFALKNDLIRLSSERLSDKLMTAIICSALNNKKEIISYLLEKYGISYDLQGKPRENDNYLNHIYSLAEQNQAIEIMVMINEFRKYDPVKIDPVNDLFLLAARRGDIKTLKEIVTTSHKRILWYRHSERGIKISPLYQVCTSGSVEALEYLLEEVRIDTSVFYKVEIDRSYHGYPEKLITFDLEGFQPDIIKCLKRYFCKELFNEIAGVERYYTVFDDGIFNRLFKNKLVNLNYQDPASGDTPLHVAVKITCDYADYCARRSKMQIKFMIVTDLLMAKVDTEIKNNMGQTALDLAKMIDMHYVEILENKGQLPSFYEFYKKIQRLNQRNSTSSYFTNLGSYPSTLWSLGSSIVSATARMLRVTSEPTPDIDGSSMSNSNANN